MTTGGTVCSACHQSNGQRGYRIKLMAVSAPLEMTATRDGRAASNALEDLTKVADDSIFNLVLLDLPP